MQSDSTEQNVTESVQPVRLPMPPRPLYCPVRIARDLIVWQNPGRSTPPPSPFPLALPSYAMVQLLCHKSYHSSSPSANFHLLFFPPRIRTMGSSVRSQDHPDGRAILYEEATYSKRKISDFISILEGFQASLKIVESFSAHVTDFHSKTLRRIVTLPDKQG